MAVFGSFWQFMVVYGSFLAVFGTKWHDFGKFVSPANRARWLRVGSGELRVAGTRKTARSERLGADGCILEDYACHGNLARVM